MGNFHDKSDARAAQTPSPGRARRRQLLAAGGLGGALALVALPIRGSRSSAFGVASWPAPARREADIQAPRELWLTRPEAQEQVRAVYWADGVVQPEGYRALEHLFRDIAEGAHHPISLALLDLNFALQSAIGAVLKPRPIVLFSGYRTARTSARVGGAVPDIHGLGLADDFIVPGLSFDDNLRLARLFQVGGLGAYPARGSLHKDVGRRRSWVDTTRSDAGRGVA